MQIYLPIADIPVNIFVVLTMGLAIGFISGMFGIGGGVSLIGEELLFGPLRRYVDERGFAAFAGLTDIVPAALGEEVVVHGALALASQSDPAKRAAASGSRPGMTMEARSLASFSSQFSISQSLTEDASTAAQSGCRRLSTA